MKYKKYENDERIIVLHMKHMRKHIWGSTELCLLLICRTIVKQHNESETNSMSTIKFQHDKNKMRTENETWRDRRMENDILLSNCNAEWSIWNVTNTKPLWNGNY